MVRRRRSLPIVHKASYPAGFLQFRQQVIHRLRLTRQDQTAPDISQRLEDELSQVHSRMRQMQSLVLNVAIAAVEHVDVDGSRKIFAVTALAP